MVALPRVLVRIVVAVALCTTAAPSAAGAQPDGRPPSGTAVSVTCPIDVPDGAECGELVVPENHDEPDGPELRLPYVIIRNRSGSAEPDPVIFTTGGPGYSSLSSAWGFAESATQWHRDVIVFEQRGNRYARPALTCDLSVLWDEVAGQTQCLDSIEAQGVDVTQYTAVDMADDIVALRRALGYEQWNLYGTSFSTSLMLMVMETDPEGIRSVVLSSVKPPNETVFAHESESPLRAVEVMLDACEADDECRAAYPELEADLLSLIRRLGREPIPLEVEVPGRDGSIPVELDGDAPISWIVINQMYGPVFPDHGAASLPLLITRAEAGDTTPIERAARSYWWSWLGNSNWAWGVMFAVNCQEDLPAAGNAPTTSELEAREILGGFARSSAQRDICAAWDLAAQGPARSEPVESDIPALVMAGSFDPVTPPAWSRATAEHLTAGQYVEFAGHGHNVTEANPCAANLIAAFLDEPRAELDTNCLADTPGPSFVVPDDLYSSSNFSRSRDEVSIGAPEGVGWIENTLISVLLTQLFVVAAIVTLGTRWLVRGRPRPIDRSAVLAGGLGLLTAVTVLTLPFVMTAVNDHYKQSPEIEFSLGLRRDLLPATLLAWLAALSALATLALTAVSLWAWLGGRWRLGFRCGATIATVASLAMLLLGLRWDLYGLLI